MSKMLTKMVWLSLRFDGPPSRTMSKPLPRTIDSGSTAVALMIPVLSGSDV